MRRISLAALFVLVGCSDTVSGDQDPWSFEEDGVTEETPDSTNPNPVDPAKPAEPTDPEPPDPEPIDPGEPVEPAPGCASADAEMFEVGGDRGTTVHVVGDRVFVNGRQPSHADFDILEWVDGELIPRTSDNGVDDFAFTGQGRYLWLSSGAQLARFDLQRNVVEPLPTALAAPGRFDFGAYAQPRSSSYDDRVAWVTSGGVHLFDGAGTQMLDVRAQAPPWVGPDGVTWFRYLDNEWVVEARIGDGTLSINGAGQVELGWPVLAAGDLYYLAGGEVERDRLGPNGSTELRVPGVCGPLHSDNATVVTACNPGVLPETSWGGDYLAIGATELWEIDASAVEARRIRTTDGATIYGPVVNERWIAWVEYEPLTNSNRGPIGTVMVQFRALGEPLAVARMGQGCPYCGAYWPPPRLVLGTNTIAWNYAIPPDAAEAPVPPAGGEYVGVARLKDCQPD